MCCLLKHKNECDKEFKVSNFDKFCGKSRGSKYETCCTACQVGEEIAIESNECSMSEFENLIENSLRDLIYECCERKKRISMKAVPEKMVSCPNGFYYNENSKQCGDINECEIENNGCEDSQLCVNSIGSYACVPRTICKKGYQFNHVNLTCNKECSDMITETLDSSPTKEIDSEFSASMNFSVQSLPIDNHMQVCPQGFFYHENAKKCNDIDECRAEGKMCAHTCQNFPGGFKCHCRRGFQIDPKNRSNCLDINECTNMKNRCSHKCRNVKGSYRCGCPKGFKLGPNKRTCADLNECIEKRGTCGKQICNNLIGTYACYAPSCPSEYKIYRFTKRNDFR